MEATNVKTNPQINILLDDNEKVLWKGKPVLKVYILSALSLTIFGFFFLGFSLIWEFFAIFTCVMALFGIPFIVIGLAMVLSPLWRYLSHKNVEYVFTDKRVIFSSGIMGKDFKVIDYDKIQNISVNVSWLDQLANKNTGTIIIFSGEIQHTKNGYINKPDNLIGIENPYEVFKLLKKVSHDIKTDIEYPNKLRPDENPGYKTEYSS